MPVVYTWMISVSGWHWSTIINTYVCYLLQNRVASCRFFCKFSFLVNEFHYLLHSISIFKSTLVVVSESWGFSVAVTVNITCSPLRHFKKREKGKKKEKEKRKCWHRRKSCVARNLLVLNRVCLKKKKKK